MMLLLILFNALPKTSYGVSCSPVPIKYSLESLLSNFIPRSFKKE